MASPAPLVVSSNSFLSFGFDGIGDSSFVNASLIITPSSTRTSAATRPYSLLFFFSARAFFIFFFWFSGVFGDFNNFVRSSSIMRLKSFFDSLFPLRFASSNRDSRSWSLSPFKPARTCSK